MSNLPLGKHQPTFIRDWGSRIIAGLNAEAGGVARLAFVLPI
jgi:hypothetical protein